MAVTCSQDSHLLCERLPSDVTQTLVACPSAQSTSAICHAVSFCFNLSKVFRNLYFSFLFFYVEKKTIDVQIQWTSLAVDGHMGT